MYPPPPNWLPRQRGLRRPAIVTRKARWTSGHLTVVRIAYYQRCRVDDEIMVKAYLQLSMLLPTLRIELTCVLSPGCFLVFGSCIRFPLLERAAYSDGPYTISCFGRLGMYGVQTVEALIAPWLWRSSSCESVNIVQTHAFDLSYYN